MCGVGGVSPLLFGAAFSYAPYPGSAWTPQYPVLACTRRDSPFHRILPFSSAGYLAPSGTSRLLGLGRIIARGRPCRFCAIAMTLATHTCVWLRAQVVGGLSSAAVSGHRQPHSPSPLYMGRGIIYS